MGRTGGSGGHSSGGGHSHGFGSHGSSHSHLSRGGRSVGRNNIGGSGRGFSSIPTPPSRPGVQPKHMPPQPPRHVHPPYGAHYPERRYPSTRGSGNTLWGKTLAIIVLIIIIATAYLSVYGTPQTFQSTSVTASTTQREKIDSPNAYISNCIKDEIGWINNEKKTASRLKEFYKKTGCQPYILLKAYDPSMNTESAREAWSKEYYDTHFAENQNVVLYTYFCDEFDEGIGNDTLFVGTDSGIVMDAEACEIFWDYLDYNWEHWDANDNDGMFIDTFNKTADRIMTVTTTSNDLKRIGLIAVIVIVCIIGIVILISKKYRREKEKAQETIDILNAPLDTSDTKSEELVDKYL